MKVELGAPYRIQTKLINFIQVETPQAEKDKNNDYKHF